MTMNRLVDRLTPNMFTHHELLKKQQKQPPEKIWTVVVDISTQRLYRPRKTSFLSCCSK